MNEPQVHVGILFEPQIEFTLHAPYRIGGNEVTGHQAATYDHGRILWQGRLYDELLFEPQDEQTASFELHGVTIGINFHWERKEDQRFQGALKIIVEDGKLTGINVVRVEDYLTSVISSEMSATASLELLKAHAVISRSWLLAQIGSPTAQTPRPLPRPLPEGRGEGDKTSTLSLRKEGGELDAGISYPPLPLGEGPGERPGESGDRHPYQTANPLTYSLLKSYQSQMKKESTEAERIMWQILRGKQLGDKFRRQHIIGNNIADFVCLEKKLVIEIDGGYHSTLEQQAYDEERTRYLQTQGYKVLRFTNEAVVATPETVLNQIKAASSPLSAGEGTGERPEEDELIRWFDREDHTRFDVCADDHCQRYQGITRASTDIVRQAILATRGQVLMSEGRICDARFSKCCGGAFEEFQYCWEDTPYPYLLKQRDWRVRQGNKSEPAGDLPDLTIEAEADRWIRTSPEAFCNTTDKHILSQVLNNYDQETTDFYRWRVEYTQEELSALILKRSGVDYGQIIALVPVARGTSGRLWKLKIVGTKKTLTIGKELEIRRTLSPSHLYSSAFVVDKYDLSPEGIPGRFTLIGAGWGHGVGLCQIGAAVMGEQGYKYDEILLHYYIGASIEKIYS